MEKNKRLINILLVIIVVLVVCGCVLAYSYFTKDKTKPIINPEEKKTIQYQEIIFSEGNYPKVDALNSTVPLAEAFKANFTGIDKTDIEITSSETHDLYKKLVEGKTDLILVTSPDEVDKKMIKESEIELEIVPIVKDAFVFFVNKENPIEGLTLDQIQGIYSGKIKNWKTVGGENEKIIAYQRPESSYSQIGMKSLIMQDENIINPVSETVEQYMSDIIDVISDYGNEKNAIGYSYSYYATKIYSKDNMKLLAINDIDPSYENIQTGLYSFQISYYAVIRKNEAEDSNVRKLLDLMKSERGQNVAKEAGYVQNY